MSIDMDVGASQSQADSVTIMTKKAQQSYQEIVEALQAFVEESRLKSAAYDNGKQFYSSVLIPLVQAGTLLSEAVEAACQKFPAEYQAEVDSGDLKSDELEEQIQRLSNHIDQLQLIQNDLNVKNLSESLKSSLLFRNERMMERLFMTKTILQEKLDKLVAFHGSSPQIFSEIKQLEAIVTQGADQAGGSWNASSKSFSMPKDLFWTQNVSERWVIRDKRLKGIDDRKVEQLKNYDVYAIVVYDVNGNPKVMWQLEKEGKGVQNRDLTKYLKKAGKYLDPELFTFITYDQWDEKVKAGWREGYNYVTGEKYNIGLSGLLSTGQMIEDGYHWVYESELGGALMVLGFSYASYRMSTQNGMKKIDSKNASGAKYEITWDKNINPTQEVIPNTNIPKSFTLKGTKVNGKEVWVHGNASKHMGEFINSAKGSIITENELMLSFQGSVSSILPKVNPGRNFFNVNGWEIGINGDTGVIYHALYKP